MRIARRSIAVLGIGLAGLLALAWAAGPGAESLADAAAAEPSAAGKSAGGSTAVMVTAAPAALRPVERTVDIVGTLAGFDEISVNAEISGRVVRVHADLGDTVKPGDLLLEIDPTDYELTVMEARRSMESDLAKLGLTELPEGQVDLEQLPTVRRAHEQEVTAQRRYERAKLLHEQNKVVSLEQLDQVRMDYEVARNTRLQALLDAQSDLAMARWKAAQLATAENRLQKTRVVAPQSSLAAKLLGPEGVEFAVAERKVNEGEMLKDSPGSSTATYDLVVDKVLKLEGVVPERYVSEVRVEQPVEIRVQAYPNRTFAGKITRISPAVDRVSRTFGIEATVENLNRELRAGSFADARIITQANDQALMVPRDAVLSLAGSTRVFTIREGKAHAVAVTRGVERDGWVELLKADSHEIGPGTMLVTSGQDLLAEGSAVKIRGAADQR